MQEDRSVETSTAKRYEFLLISEQNSNFSYLDTKIARYFDLPPTIFLYLNGV